MKAVHAIRPRTIGSASNASNAEHEHQDLDHRQIDPAENDAVDGNPEIERAEAAQECGGFAGIADLGELDIGHDAGAPPEPRVEEDRHHAAGDEAPPEPVAGDSALRAPCR